MNKVHMQAYGTHTEPYSCFKLNEFFKYLLPRAHLLRKETKQKKNNRDRCKLQKIKKNTCTIHFPLLATHT